MPPPLAPGLSANVQVYRKGSGLRELPPVGGWGFRREAEQSVEAALGREASLALGEDATKDLETL